MWSLALDFSVSGQQALEFKSCSYDYTDYGDSTLVPQFRILGIIEVPFSIIIFKLDGTIYKAFRLYKSTPILTGWTISKFVLFDDDYDTIVIPFNNETNNPGIIFMDYPSGTVSYNYLFGDPGGSV